MVSTVETCLYAIDVLVDVPCFVCIMNKHVTPFYCDPKTCEILELWLLEMVKHKRLRGILCVEAVV